jgi:hypothetical protein
MSGLKGLERKLSVIRGAKFVITDTYHLAISALREGVPALCIGWGAQGIEGSLSDKKKEIFFQQSMLRPNYLFVEQVFEAMRSDTSTVNLARTALKAVSDGLALGLAFELLRKQAAQAAQRCRQALDLASH